MQNLHWYSHSLDNISDLFNPIEPRMAKTLWSFGHFECNRVNAESKIAITSLTQNLLLQ